MKVIIGKDETYEIKLPEELPVSQLDPLIDRLNKIRKLFSGDVLSAPSEITRSTDSPIKKNKRTMSNYTREQLIEFMKIYKSNLPLAERVKAIEEMTGKPYKRFQTSLFYYQKKFNLRGDEMKGGNNESGTV